MDKLFKIGKLIQKIGFACTRLFIDTVATGNHVRFEKHEVLPFSVFDKNSALSFTLSTVANHLKNRPLFEIVPCLFPHPSFEGKLLLFSVLGQAVSFSEHS